jgi:cytochrome P460
MRSKNIRIIVLAGAFLSGMALLALAAQDKYTLTVPNGLAFSEFRGYEDWQTIAVSQTEGAKVLRAILGNPVMMKAEREGFAGNGKPFPDGSRMAKILWNQKKLTDHAPFSVSAPDTVPDTLQAVELMVKDSKRFPDTRGWGYGKFVYDTASGTFKPLGTGAACGAACHEAAAKNDYVFTQYSLR